MNIIHAKNFMAAALPSWNDGAAKKSVVEFVASKNGSFYPDDGCDTLLFILEYVCGEKVQHSA